MTGSISDQSVQITTFVDTFIFFGDGNLNYIADSLAITMLLVYMSQLRSNTLLPIRDTASLIFGAICAIVFLFPTFSIANAWLQPFGTFSAWVAEWQLAGLGEWAQETGNYIEGLERTQFTRTAALLIGFAVLGFIPLSIMGTILFITSIANRWKLGGFRSRNITTFLSGIYAGLLGCRQNLVWCLISAFVGPIATALTAILFLALVDVTSGLRKVLVTNYLPVDFPFAYVGLAHVFACASISIFIGLSSGTVAMRHLGMKAPPLRSIGLICSVLFLFGILSMPLLDFTVDNATLKSNLSILVMFAFAVAVPAIWTLSLLNTLGGSARAFVKSRQQHLASLNAPWLFLRAFSLDAKLVAWPFDAFRAIPFLGRRKYRLEHVLAEATFRFGPVVAVGNPSDPIGDHGIPREFLSDEGWQPFVEESIKNYRGTIFLMGDGGYLAWETSKIVEFGAQKRTIFVAPPHITDSQKYLNSISDLSAGSKIPSSILDRVGSGDCIAFYWASNGWVAILNRRRSAHDYRMAMHKALYDMSRAS